MHQSFRQFLLAAAAVVAFGGVATAPTPAAACGTDGYMGTICYFAMPYCPQGFIAANGQLVQVAEYTALYALLGKHFGSQGETAFNLPDLRGRVPVGVGIGTNVLPVALGQKLGAFSVTLTAAQVPLLPHSHKADLELTSGTQSLTVPGSSGTGLSFTNGQVQVSTTAASAAPVLTAGGTAYLAAAVAGTGPNALRGLYTATPPTSPSIATIPVTGTITGTASTSAMNFNVPTVTGGTVTVQQTGSTSGLAPVGIQPPSLGLTACIMTHGLFPPKP